MQSQGRSKRSAKTVPGDDQAMLEPDWPTDSKRRSGKAPTDIADILADTEVAEQRQNPAFVPSVGPYGRSNPILAQPPPGLLNGRSRRPTAQSQPISNGGLQGNLPLPLSHRQLAQQAPQQPVPQQSTAGSPYVSNRFEFVDDNSLLGSGNFDIVKGGTFREPGDYNQYNNPYAPASNGLGQQNYRPQQPYQQPSPPSFYPQNNNNLPPPGPAHNGYPPNYPTFFGGDDFFSNFRDFADVNLDYRN